MTKKTTKVRVQFDLAEESHERLQRLKEITEASSYADVTKNSYKLYEMVIGYYEQGYELVLEKDGEKRHVELFY
jgi:hypothetical protein